MTALAIDVGSALSARRFYRSVADASSLAGGQDLQQGTGRAVTDAERERARTDAMASLVSLLGATSAPTCPSTADVVDCAIPGTPYVVSIKTPSPSCVDCIPERSVQVTVRNPTFGLTFSRLFGQTSWDVASTSVAGLAYNKSYAIVTLRPPRKTGSTFDVNDIDLNGTNTVVDVHQGDVGSNANMTYSGTSTVVNLDPGYGMYYFDPIFPPKWYPSPPMPPNQIVQHLSTLIADPMYQYPSMAGAPTFNDARQSQVPLPAVTRADQDNTCLDEAKKINATRYSWMTTQLANPDTIFCYNPGIYESGSGAKNASITIPTGTLGILKPGAYYLKSGVDVSGRLVGGYEPGKPGVALMLDEAGPGNCPSCIFSGNNALTIALNAGTKFPFGTAGTAATAAVDWNGQNVQTSGPASPTPPVIMTLLVRKDTNGSGGSQACVVPTSPPYIEPAQCAPSKNQTINIAGGGQLSLEGVQYLPTDNVAIAGSSDGRGTVGQIIAWTIRYSGGTTINQEGVGNEGPGILRLDAACTTPLTSCNSP